MQLRGVHYPAIKEELPLPVRIDCLEKGYLPQSVIKLEGRRYRSSRLDGKMLANKCPVVANLKELAAILECVVALPVPTTVLPVSLSVHIASDNAFY
jgi:hypothetical protein